MKNFLIGLLTHLGTYSIFVWGVITGIVYTECGINDMHTILPLLAGTIAAIRAGMAIKN